MKNLKKTTLSAICAVTLSLGLASTPERVVAGVEPYLGDIMIVGFNFCPRGWAAAEGQILPINTNPALFSLLGTQFGGDGRTSFALPDLRGRLTMGQGAGPSLTPRSAAQRSGSETKTMTQATMANHNHLVNANNLDGDKPGPGNKLLAAAPTGGAGNETIYSTAAATVQMSASMIGASGSSTQIPTQDPYLTLYHCIALQGLFPPRS